MVCIEQRITISAPIQRCFDLSRSIEVHLVGTEDTRVQAVNGITCGLIGPGQFVRWRAKHLGVWQYLSSRITQFNPPYFFQDVMIEGAFSFMQHCHYFKPLDNGKTEMRDVFNFAAPVPLLGILAERIFLRRHMDELLKQRSRVIAGIAESTRWREFVGVR